jgi:hypothetical protein
MSGILYVGGAFIKLYDQAQLNLGHIVRYDTAAGSWHRLPDNGLNVEVHALAVSASDLYAGGIFTKFGGRPATSLGGIVRAALALPEIQVLDRATDIPDGTGSVDFGTTTVGTPLDRSRTVSNTGTADLTLTEPIGVPSGFSVASSFGSTTVAAGTATAFTVRLDAVAPGTYSDKVQLANNDSDEDPFDFTISGTVKPHRVHLPLFLK